jgi:predicted extracellular nuclease
MGPALTIFDLTATGVTPIIRMSRGALRIRVQHPATTIDILTAHLKSKLLSFPRLTGSSFAPRNEDERAQVAGIALMKRTAEAVTLSMKINDFLEGNVNSPLILLGDFNDVPEAQTSLILCGPPGSEIGTRGFNTADQGDDQRMFNLTNAIVDPERRYSRIHDGRKEMLDQIFASEELFPVQNSKRVLPVVDSLIDFHQQLPSVTNNPALRIADIAPDHAPVIATFSI